LFSAVITKTIEKGKDFIFKSETTVSPKVGKTESPEEASARGMEIRLLFYQARRGPTEKRAKHRGLRAEAFFVLIFWLLLY
jgi:hypothetical protein